MEVHVLKANCACKWFRVSNKWAIAAPEVISMSCVYKRSMTVCVIWVDKALLSLRPLGRAAAMPPGSVWAATLDGRDPEALGDGMGSTFGGISGASSKAVSSNQGQT
eukprot:CAMPEP_0180576376 /NCGR_PEP_ID=MMETSP1037_2-20121125/11384_1 /TAXON_ID=632150 /ORGANISM="Azadinium spinosum, Strain 3D9" /LENGTH=106 /DNA_ID=CAMNT_0022594085 /DNA_START=48 /DNA_END=364 /DNA_ORIENTATION=-